MVHGSMRAHAARRHDCRYSSWTCVLGNWVPSMEQTRIAVTLQFLSPFPASKPTPNYIYSSEDLRCGEAMFLKLKSQHYLVIRSAALPPQCVFCLQLLLRSRPFPPCYGRPAPSPHGDVRGGGPGLAWRPAGRGPNSSSPQLQPRPSKRSLIPSLAGNRRQPGCAGRAHSSTSGCRRSREEAQYQRRGVVCTNFVLFVVLGLCSFAAPDLRPEYGPKAGPDSGPYLRYSRETPTVETTFPVTRIGPRKRSRFWDQKGSKSEAHLGHPNSAMEVTSGH